jgi:hypothetical protein
MSDNKLSYHAATATSPADLLPVIEVQNQTVGVNGSIEASSLIASTYDPYGYAITYYDFRDDGGGGGSLSLDGTTEPTDTWITVAASDLSGLEYVGGASAGDETIDVAAWDGDNWSYYNTATVTTEAVLLPVITVQNETVDANAVLQASSLIGTVTDPNGYAITYYDFRDDGGGGGYLSLDGTMEPTDTWITVAASDLSQLEYVGGSSAGSETVDVAAWDGDNWSYYQTATVTTQAALLPVITVQSGTVDANAVLQASTLIGTVTDPNGFAITAYDFRDDGGGGGYLSLGGVTEPTDTWITVAASDLSELEYIGGPSAGTETVDVAAWDGDNWSDYQTTTVTTQAAAAGLPVITVQNQAVPTGGSIEASSLIASVNGYAITTYDFRDEGGGGGYLSLDGTTEPTDTWITVTASDLADLQYVGGASAGTETIDVADSEDGVNWSYYQSAIVTTRAVLAPVITVEDATVTSGSSIEASSLILSVLDPNNLAITAYDFRDDGGGGGSLILNGETEATGEWITVSASDLSQLTFVGGSSAGSETIDVAASNGEVWSSYATATVITKPAQNVNPPTVVANDATVDEYQSIQASSLIGTVSDPSNLPITYDGFYDQGGNAGYFILNGLQQPTGSWITVSTSDLPDLLYVGGSTAGTEDVDVAVWDGESWSNAVPATITTAVAEIDRPVITVQNQTVDAKASIEASSLIASVSDPSGATIAAYDFRDDGGGGGELSLSGTTEPTDTWITVTASDLADLQYVGGASAGTETIDVAASNGMNWSYSESATVTTAVASLPVITAQDQTVASGASIEASSLIASVNDPNQNAITSYEFRDDGGGGGDLSLNGTTEPTGTWITVTATDLSQLDYVGGSTAGSETIDVAAYDGVNWSNYATAIVTTQGTLPTDPVIEKLTDAGVKADAEKYIVNGTLSYSGMLTILDDVATAGITASSFADLKTIVSYFDKSNGIQVSPYLAYISNSLVNGDPANAYWTGGALTTEPLGDLSADSTQTQLNDLIGKWFLGTDLPAPVFDGVPAGTSISYVNDTDPLFGANGTPTINDINQGQLGDCYLLASLAEIAQDQPSAIDSMFADNGDIWHQVLYRRPACLCDRQHGTPGVYRDRHAVRKHFSGYLEFPGREGLRGTERRAGRSRAYNGQRLQLHRRRIRGPDHADHRKKRRHLRFGKLHLRHVGGAEDDVRRRDRGRQRSGFCVAGYDRYRRQYGVRRRPHVFRYRLRQLDRGFHRAQPVGRGERADLADRIRSQYFRSLRRRRHYLHRQRRRGRHAGNHPLFRHRHADRHCGRRRGGGIVAARRACADGCRRHRTGDLARSSARGLPPPSPPLGCLAGAGARRSLRSAQAEPRPLAVARSCRAASRRADSDPLPGQRRHHRPGTGRRGDLLARGTASTRHSACRGPAVRELPRHRQPRRVRERRRTDHATSRLRHAGLGASRLRGTGAWRRAPRCGPLPFACARACARLHPHVRPRPPSGHRQSSRRPQARRRRPASLRLAVWCAGRAHRLARGRSGRGRYSGQGHALSRRHAGPGGRASAARATLGNSARRTPRRCRLPRTGGRGDAALALDGRQRPSGPSEWVHRWWQSGARPACGRGAANLASPRSSSDGTGRGRESGLIAAAAVAGSMVVTAPLHPTRSAAYRVGWVEDTNRPLLPELSRFLYGRKFR